MRRRGVAPWFAACFWCAVACQEGKEPPVAATGSLADSADQTMYRARSIITDRGMMRAELLADSAFFFDDNTRIEMRGVHTTFYTSTGAKNAVLTSQEGTYRTRNGGMSARGNVVVVSEDGRRLTTEELTFDPAANQIASDSAFVLTQGEKKGQGIGFRSDPNATNFFCLRACTGFVGSVDLPQEQTGGAPAPKTPATNRDTAKPDAPDSLHKRPTPARSDSGRP